MQYSTFFTFRHFILFFWVLIKINFVAETNTNELLYHIFVSSSRYIIIDIYLSFAAEANANAILYIFHFQTLHTVFFGCSFVVGTNTSELLYHIFVSRSRDIIIYIYLSFAADANANAILYIFHFQTCTSYCFFGCSFVAETNTSELLYHVFVSRSRDIIIDIYLSFAAEANANAIFYIFHFQTLHTVFLGAH